MCSHLQTGGWDGARPAQNIYRNCRKKSLMVKDRLSIIHVHFRLCMYSVISQWYTVMQAKDKHKCSAVYPDPGAGKLTEIFE
jgi:hypothetical protein